MIYIMLKKVFEVLKRVEMIHVSVFMMFVNAIFTYFVCMDGTFRDGWMIVIVMLADWSFGVVGIYKLFRDREVNEKK